LYTFCFISVVAPLKKLDDTPHVAAGQKFRIGAYK
jgi:hypothetical protein